MMKNINSQERIEEIKQKDFEMIKDYHTNPQSTANPYLVQLKKIQYSSMYGVFGNNR